MSEPKFKIPTNSLSLRLISDTDLNSGFSANGKSENIPVKLFSSKLLLLSLGLAESLSEQANNSIKTVKK